MRGVVIACLLLVLGSEVAGGGWSVGGGVSIAVHLLGAVFLQLLFAFATLVLSGV